MHRRLYQAEDVSRFDLSDFVRDTVRETANATGRLDVTLSFDVDPLTVPAQQASPIALMLNELVINALKYAFPDARARTLVVSIRRAVGV